MTFNSYSRENSVAQNYQYNGKEKQDELDLGWLDYGWRSYDPALGRWLGIDFLAHRYDNSSPYAYCKNNPIAFFDPNGMEIKNEATERRKKAEQAVKDYGNAVAALSKMVHVERTSRPKVNSSDIRSIITGLKMRKGT